MDHKYEVAKATEELNDLLNKPGILIDAELERVARIMDEQTVLEKTKGEISLRELKNAIDDIEIKAKTDQQKKLDQMIKDATSKRPAANVDQTPKKIDPKILGPMKSKMAQSVANRSKKIKALKNENRKDKMALKQNKKMLKKAIKTIKNGKKATKKN